MPLPPRPFLPLLTRSFSTIRPYYDVLTSESKWRSSVLTPQHHSTEQQKKKKNKYVLAMFPYPSGRLHLGHVRVYAISDAFARVARMKGDAVLHPMGWDAFGLPAENAARDNKAATPEEWTWDNIAKMREQLYQLGFAFDWSQPEALQTCSPQYYKWTQSLFLRLYHQGLAYRAKGEVNWDPIDQTVLANEQVDAQGRSWRSGAVVEKKLLDQWYIKLTNYAPDLVRGLKDLQWPEKVKSMQEQWIGETHGAIVRFPTGNDAIPFVQVFTTRPDTIMGVQFVALSPTDDLWHALQAHGITSVMHPLKNTNIPLVQADYVVKTPWAVMGVPAHDDKDALFAKSNNISFSPSSPLLPRHEVMTQLATKGLGHDFTKYRIRDWLVSRQRRWGCPIPMISCPSCGFVPVPEDDLPVLLPPDMSPRTCTCPKCQRVDAVRDPDTLDTFVDSSFYFVRFCDPNNTNELARITTTSQWMPVNIYVGGVEHAILHLLYARFMTRFLFHQGIVPSPEPFTRLVAQGMVLGKTWKNVVTGEYVKNYDGGGGSDNIAMVWEKMSKSKHNGVDPKDVVDKHGADPTRLAVLFAGPVEKDVQWLGDAAVNGQARFLQRVWELVVMVVNNNNNNTKDEENSHNNEKSNLAVQRAVIACVDHVTHALTEKNVGFNVAIAELMKLTNTVKAADSADRQVLKRAVETLVTMLAPLAPYFSQEAWSWLQPEQGNVHAQSWPNVEDWRHRMTTHNTNTNTTATINVRVVFKEQKTSKVLALQCPGTVSNEDILQRVWQEIGSHGEMLSRSRNKDGEEIIVIRVP